MLSTILFKAQVKKSQRYETQFYPIKKENLMKLLNSWYRFYLIQSSMLSFRFISFRRKHHWKMSKKKRHLKFSNGAETFINVNI